MAKLNIELVADAQKMLGGLNQSTESASKLFKKLVEGEDVAERFSQAFERDLSVAADKAGSRLQSLKNQLNELLKYQEKARLACGDTSDEYTTLADLVGEAKDEIDKITKANRDAAEAMRAEAEETARVEEMTRRLIAQMDAENLEAFAGAIDDINKMMRQMEAEEKSLQQLNKKNADLGFMWITGDELGVANMTLREYEQNLKEVIASTGLNSIETKQATAAYMEQKAVVDQLTASQSKLEVASKGALGKLVSIAGNIFKFQLLMGPITSAIRGFKETISDSIKVAAEAEQIYGKLATVFDTVADSANKAAGAISEALGVSKSTAADALSTVGDLLQAQGMGTSESLTTASSWVSQFYDIINFKNLNMSLNEFAQNFMSGAAGNLRNFRTFGSIVKESAVNARLAAEGYDKLTGSQLELQKMVTRATMALEQQANAMGATKREWESALAVNRRYEETAKSLKENLGELINTALKPMKSWWTEILNTINKAVKAANEYAKGVRDINVFDVKNNAEDRSMFRSALRDTPATLLKQDIASSSFDVNNPVDSEYLSQLEAVNRLLVMYGVTVHDFAGYLKEWGYENVVSASTLELLRQKEKERNAELKRQAEIEERRTTIESIASDYDSFTEALKAITGVSIDTPDWTAQSRQFAYSEGGEALFASNVKNSIFGAVSNAISSLGTSSYEELANKFGDVIAGALDELDEGELRQAQLDSLRSLFETTWNEFAEGGFTDEEVKKLQEIKDEYGRLNEELEAYNLKLKNQENFLSALNSLSGEASSYDVQLAQLGMTNDQKEMDNLKRSYASAKAYLDPESETYAKDLADLDEAFEEAQKNLLALQNATNKYNKQLEAEANEKERISEYEDAVRSINESMTDYANQIGQIGMTDEEKALDDLRIAFEKQLKALDLKHEEEDALTELYEDQTRALGELQRKQKAYNDKIAAQASATNIVGSAQQSFLDRTLIQEYMSRGIKVDNKIYRNPNEAQATALLEYNKQMQQLSADLAKLDHYVNEAGETVYDFGNGIEYSNVQIDEILHQKLINDLDSLADAAEEAAITWADIYSDANPFANEVSAFNSGKEASEGGIGGGIWALLLELLKNTEVFKTLVDLFKDTFVPILDAILKPLMPVLKMFAAFFDNLDWEMAFEIIKIIAQVLAGTLFVIKAAINTIEAVVKTIYYAITFQWGKIGDLWRDFVDTTKEDYAKMEECLGEIQNSTFEIARNTDEEGKDLALLRDLYNRGIIDESTYYKESGSLQGNYLPTPVAPSYPTSRSVNTGNIIFNISGTNPKEAAREVAMELKRLGMANIDTDSFAFAVGGY